MDIFLKATCGILITLVLCLVISKQSKDISVLLTVIVCCMVSIAAMQHLQPVITFFEKIQSIGQLDPTFVRIVIRSVGIGLLSEIAGHICLDAGNAALGKTLQILASAVILWMSLPLFTKVIELIEEILVVI